MNRRAAASKELDDAWKAFRAAEARVAAAQEAYVLAMTEPITKGERA